MSDHRPTAAANASGISDSSEMRARTSSLRLVSWVDDANMVAGHFS